MKQNIPIRNGIKEQIAQMYSNRIAFALVTGGFTIIGGIATLVGGSILFQSTFSSRLNFLEIYATEDREQDQKILEQLDDIQDNLKDNEEDIMDIGSKVTELYNYLIQK